MISSIVGCLIAFSIALNFVLVGLLREEIKQSERNFDRFMDELSKNVRDLD